MTKERMLYKRNLLDNANKNKENVKNNMRST